MKIEYKTKSLAETLNKAIEMIYLSCFVLAKREDGVMACAKLYSEKNCKLSIGYRLPNGKITHWAVTEALAVEGIDLLEYHVRAIFNLADKHIAMNINGEVLD